MKKTALVTGANRGLGLTTSIELAKIGYRVYMGCRNLKEVEPLETKLLKQELDIQFIQLDTNSIADMRNTFNILSSNEGYLDLLVNNAGVFLDSVHTGQGQSILEADKVMILKSIETNTMGPMQLTQSLVSLLEKSKHGQVINISSGMGSLEEMESSSTGYRMSKTALNVLTRIFSHELASMNIRVNSVCPGWCRSDMGGENASRSLLEGVQTTLWLATSDHSETGKFFRDKVEVPW